MAAHAVCVRDGEVLLARRAARDGTKRWTLPGGSTDRAAWRPLDAVPGLSRVALVDIGLDPWRERPPVGRSRLAGRADDRPLRARRGAPCAERPKHTQPSRRRSTLPPGPAVLPRDRTSRTTASGEPA
ncbi:NUDIX hydrolase [Streptomyces sp. NPDC087215]|uniref:NUDIX hydrolase n=1 Tax=Streptomyces sp. NPDC087215 TaxID=3365767 RepID=UPI0038269E87